MNITSFPYFVFIAAAVLLYYVIPKNYRWFSILLANIGFLVMSNSVKLNILWLFTALVTYFGALLIKKNSEKNPKISKVLVYLCVLCVLGFMIGLKDLSFFSRIADPVLTRLGLPASRSLAILAPLGISYYSLVWIGYLLDVYWGTCEVEGNILKFLAFCGYFPTYVSGPIVKFQDIEKEIVTGHALDYNNLTFGTQRILWGLMKKLIISERLAIVVNTVYGDYNRYPGAYIWIAMFCFVFQLYTDFSGCIDIVLGTSQLFGIQLPENFNLPFLSTSLAEFWRRWHITLGGWLRDYVLYPILKSDLLQWIGSKSKKAFGKKTGKKIPTWIGLMISWFLIGFWHGGQWNYIIGVGLFFGFIIVSGEALEPFFKKVIALLKINTEAVSYRIFQRLRTFFFFMVGLSFFRSYDGFGVGLKIWKNALTVFNPWIFFDGSLLNLGLTQKDINILFFWGIVLAGSGLLTFFTKKSLRELVAEQNLVFRWILYFILLFSVLILGCYGIEFSSASFIYQRF